MSNIKELLLKKKAIKEAKGALELDDVHRDLIVALSALPIYGSDARDEDILSIIINGGVKSSYLDMYRERFKKMLADKVIKKVKGEYIDKDGCIVLEPR